MRRICLTGLPGSGKTTLVKKLLEMAPHLFVGFYTEEIREGNRRKGFRIRTTWGKSSILALEGLPSGARIGRYGVELENLGRAVSELEREMEGRPGAAVVVDEVGKMELLCAPFRRLVGSLLEGERPLLLTAPSRSSDPLVLRAKRELEVLEVTPEGRDGVLEELKRYYGLAP